MNNDLISREALKKALEPYRFAMCGFEGVLFLIDNAPAIEYTFEKAFQKTVCENKLYCPARPKGEWITRHKLNSFGQDVVCFECNKCGEYKVPLYHLLITEPLKVCPNCGADMRKGGAEE